MARFPGDVRGVLVGRDGLVDDIADRLSAGTSVVLRGSAGIGKTRLLAELHDLEDIPTWGFTASSASHAVPLGVFVSALPVTAATELGAAALVRDTLLTSGAVVTVDDAHLLDPASAGLVLELARSGVRVVIAARAGEPLPVAIDALLRDGLAVIREIPDLTRGEVRELIGALVGMPVDLGAAAAVHRRWGGNPLVVRELVSQLERSGGAQAVKGAWMLVEPLPLLASVGELLANRLSNLEPHTREVLEIVAIADPLRLEEAERLLDRAALAAAEDADLVTTDVGGLRPAHPLLRDAALLAMSPTRRIDHYAALIAARLARLDGVEPADHDRVDLALWRLACGVEVDVDELLAAAAVVLSTDAGLWDTFVEAARSRARSPREGVAIAAMLLHRHRDSEAEAVLRRWDSPDLPDDVRYGIAVARSFGPALFGSDPAVALAIIDEADEHWGRTPVLDAHRATALWRTTRVREALALARSVRDSAEAPAGARVHAALTAMSTAPYLLASKGGEDDLRALDRVITEAGTSLPEAAETRELTAALISVIWTENATHRALLDAGRERALRRGDDDLLRQWTSLSARRAVLDGDILLARQLFEDALPRTGMWSTATAALIMSRYIRALVLAGDLPAAQRRAAELDGIPHAPFHDWEVELAGAYLSAAAGARAEAADRARAIGDRCWSWGCEVGAVDAWFSAMLWGDRMSRQRLRERVGTHGSALDRVKVRVAVALDEGDPSALDAAAADFEALGAGWYALEAQTLATRSARGREAAELAQRERFRRRRHPGLVALSGDAVEGQPLTARELEIADLARSGSTDREIADALGISVRTVTTHLGRVYAKLRVAGRRDLAQRSFDSPEDYVAH